jgi:hypothetical protein
VCDAAEAVLALSDVVTDPEAIAGTSFTLTPDLCPEIWPTSDPDVQARRGDPLQALHFEFDGHLTLVASSHSGGNGQTQTLAMRQVGLGWEVSGLVTCAALYELVETHHQTQRYAAETAHLVFLRDPDSAAPSSIVIAAASTADEPLVATGVPDVTPPDYRPLEYFYDFGTVTAIDEFPYTGFAQHFFFDEPVSANASVSVTDPNGERSAEIEWLYSGGLLHGFTVYGVVPSDWRLDIEVEDLAQNRLTESRSYPGIKLQPLAGDFEGAVTTFTSAYWSVGPSYNQNCEAYGVGAFSDVNSAIPVSVPALEGSQSFLLGARGEGETECAGHFRLSRPPGTHSLVFEAQRLGDWDDTAEQLVELEVWDLPSNESVTVSDLRLWSHDSAQAGASPVQTLTFELPVDGDDLLVGIGSTHHLWIDSLRFE